MDYFLENCLLMTVAHQFCDVCGIRLSNTIKILLQLVNINLTPMIISLIRVKRGITKIIY